MEISNVSQKRSPSLDLSHGKVSPLPAVFIIPAGTVVECSSNLTLLDSSTINRFQGR